MVMSVFEQREYLPKGSTNKEKYKTKQKNSENVLKSFFFLSFQKMRITQELIYLK